MSIQISDFLDSFSDLLRLFVFGLFRTFAGEGVLGFSELLFNLFHFRLQCLGIHLVHVFSLKALTVLVKGCFLSCGWLKSWLLVLLVFIRF